MNDKLNNTMSYHLKDGQLYFQHFLVETQDVDFDSFEILTQCRARDKYRVYDTGSVITGANPEHYEILRANSGMLRDRYSKDKQHVFFERNLIPDADAESFEVIDEFHGKDKHRVYHCSDAFEAADRDSFHGLGNSFARDKHHAYYYMRVLPEADPKTFSVYDPNHWTSFAKDARHVYDHSAQILPDVDCDSFTPFPQSLFGRDAIHVYYSSDLITGADPNSFELINDNYAKDHSHVYLHQHHLEGAMPSSFSIIRDDYIQSLAKDERHIFLGQQCIELMGNIAAFTELSANYFCDDVAVYYNSDVVEGAHPATFQIDDNGVARDQEAVYDGYERHTHIDPDTFRFIDGYFSADQQHMYFLYEKIPGLDPATFEILGEHYAADDTMAVYFDERFYQCETLPPIDKASFTVIPNTSYAYDKNQVYHCDLALPNSDPQSFRLLESAFAMDKRQVYYSDKVLSGADPQTFRCRDYRFAQDDQRMYCYDELIIDADPHSLEVLDEHYTKDKNAVFYDGVKISDCDVNSFQLIPPWYARDQQQIFSGGKALALNSETTRFLSDAYLADTSTVYFLGKHITHADAQNFTLVSARYHLAHDGTQVFFRDDVINDADPASFHCVNQFLCRDKHNNYKMQQGIWVASPR